MRTSRGLSRRNVICRLRMLKSAQRMRRLLDGYNVDHNRIQLGSGEAIYLSAVDALKNWRHFELGWVAIVPRGVPVEVGATVAVKARAFGTWSLSAYARGLHDRRSPALRVCVRNITRPC